MKPSYILLVALFALTGCIAQSRIQAKYMDQEATCRDEAEEKVKGQPTPPPASDGTVRNENSTAIFAAFSSCMNKAGWKVSVPKTATAATGTPPPSGAPGPGGVVAAKPVAAVATPAETPKGYTSPAPAAPIIGPGVQPSPASSVPPSAAPVTPVSAMPTTPSPAPASYQPGRPGAAEAPDYGTGAGRQF